VKQPNWRIKLDTFVMVNSGTNKDTFSAFGNTRQPACGIELKVIRKTNLIATHNSPFGGN
jgi:hypothetical protein